MNISTDFWNKSNLVQTRSQWYLDQTGFTIVGGIHTYSTVRGEVTVFFEEDRIYTMLRNKKPLENTKFRELIREAIRKRDVDFPCFGEYERNYTELYADGEWQDSVIQWLGLDKKDLEKRFEDIEKVWDVEEIPLCKPRIAQRI